MSPDMKCIEHFWTFWKEELTATVLWPEQDRNWLLPYSSTEMTSISRKSVAWCCQDLGVFEHVQQSRLVSQDTESWTFVTDSLHFAMAVFDPHVTFRAIIPFSFGKSPSKCIFYTQKWFIYTPAKFREVWFKPRFLVNYFLACAFLKLVSIFANLLNTLGYLSTHFGNTINAITVCT